MGRGKSRPETEAITIITECVKDDKDRKEHHFRTERDAEVIHLSFYSQPER